MACQVLHDYFSGQKLFYSRHWVRRARSQALSHVTCLTSFNTQQQAEIALAWRTHLISNDWYFCTSLRLVFTFYTFNSKTRHGLEILKPGLCMLPNSSSDQSQGALCVGTGRIYPHVSNADEYLLHWYFCVFLKYTHISHFFQRNRQNSSWSCKGAFEKDFNESYNC